MASLANIGSSEMLQQGTGTSHDFLGGLTALLTSKLQRSLIYLKVIVLPIGQLVLSLHVGGYQRRRKGVCSFIETVGSGFCHILY
jgi:hypothetical protein